MDALLGIFPIALAIGLAWLIFARRSQDDESDTNEDCSDDESEGEDHDWT